MSPRLPPRSTVAAPVPGPSPVEYYGGGCHPKDHVTPKISRAALSDADSRRLIERNCWGVLAMVDGNQPYAVPVMYGYDGATLVFINGPGHKVELLRANPRVCLVIAEVIDQGREWRSVLVRGNVKWVQESETREAALELLRTQMPFPAERLNDAAAIARAPIGRIIPTEITGRIAGN